jgi:molybdate/tungstate transport system ATP-binding protein
MIRVDHLSVRAGNFELSDVSFEIPTGQHGFLMGRTGCGKTTLLETICGLKPVRGGRVWLMGRDVTHLKPGTRGVGYVPQDGALFPTMTVREHLGFALRIRGSTQAEVENRVQELASLLGLESLLARLPLGLSGGEAQRVALGRALANHPGVLCLDEPLSALDDETRAEIRDVLQLVRKETGVTILHVTHSLQDARNMADVVFCIREGRIVASNS